MIERGCGALGASCLASDSEVASSSVTSCMFYQKTDHHNCPQGKQKSNRSASAIPRTNTKSKKRRINALRPGLAVSLPDMPVNAAVNSYEHDDANRTIGIELLQYLVLRVRRLELIGAEWRNDFPHRVKSMPYPWLLDGFCQKIGPNTKSSAQGLRLIACVRVDVIVRGQQSPKYGEMIATAARAAMHFGPAAYRLDLLLGGILDLQQMLQSWSY